MAGRAFGSRTFSPTPKGHAPKPVSSYRPPLLSKQFKSTGRPATMNFRRTTSMGGSTRMTITKSGVSFSVAQTGSKRLSRTSKGGSRYSQQLPGGYYYRKARKG